MVQSTRLHSLHGQAGWAWACLQDSLNIPLIRPAFLKDKHNGLYFSQETYHSRQHLLANCPEYSPSLKLPFFNWMLDVETLSLKLVQGQHSFSWYYSAYVQKDPLSSSRRSSALGGCFISFLSRKIGKELLFSERASHPVIKSSSMSITTI